MITIEKSVQIKEAVNNIMKDVKNGNVFKKWKMEKK